MVLAVAVVVAEEALALHGEEVAADEEGEVVPNLEVVMDKVVGTRLVDMVEGTTILRMVRRLPTHTHSQTLMPNTAQAMTTADGMVMEHKLLKPMVQLTGVVEGAESAVVVTLGISPTAAEPIGY